MGWYIKTFAAAARTKRLPFTRGGGGGANAGLSDPSSPYIQSRVLLQSESCCSNPPPSLPQLLLLTPSPAPCAVMAMLTLFFPSNNVPRSVRPRRKSSLMIEFPQSPLQRERDRGETESPQPLAALSARRHRLLLLPPRRERERDEEEKRLSRSKEGHYYPPPSSSSTSTNDYVQIVFSYYYHIRIHRSTGLFARYKQPTEKVLRKKKVFTLFFLPPLLATWVLDRPHSFFLWEFLGEKGGSERAV